ncbi:MAG: endopeptidase La, partial [Bacteroidaceae bacterium]|nr:endopeptidase La [Bacteroidaceae bacterium]
LDRAYTCLTILNQNAQMVDMMRKIEDQTNKDLSKQQREYYLNQEIRNIQRELNDGDDNADVAKLKKRAAAALLPDQVNEVFMSELEKLSRIPNGSPDYNTLLNYLETVVCLPWGKVSEDRLNIPKAKQILDRDHFGLEKVKERILEQLAIVKLRDDMRSPILCLYGPPGVGKTSLGKSIAQAMGRSYVRMSLGGVSDEAEIRGHRRTYIGAMMGRILKNIQKAGTSNPVFILDEIDKVTSTNHGDPFSALLEVLDPEQNVCFHDNYLDLDYDLSKVMFIATANNIGNIPAPLRDRMEMIEVPGYLNEEKIEIAKKHLIPKILDELGMKGLPINSLSKPIINKVIEQYTMESGVRSLEKQLTAIYRKLGYQYLMNDALPKPLKEIDLKDLLGVPLVTPEKYQGNGYAGVVTGLAWTAVGGTILMIEVSLSKGKGGKLTLTGSLGDVMKESAVLAVEYIKAHADYYGIDIRIFDHWNIHIHVPDGATPKDGPSAGITLTTALISALTQRKVRKNLAMTGEITLRGKVTAVGGIREKILAAKRAGIKEIILSEENQRHIEEIPERYITGMNFHYVKDIKEVIQYAILNEKITDPVDFTIPEEASKEAK